MKHYKISNLLNDSTVSKFVTKKWIKVNDLSIDQYSVNKSIKFKTSMLRLNLCDYSDAYILAKGAIDLIAAAAAANESDEAEKDIAFKNNAPSQYFDISSLLEYSMTNEILFYLKLFYDITKFMELLQRRN